MLDRLCEALRARDTALDGQARPAAILWTDPSRDWVPVLGLARQHLPELLTLGEYDPETRTGPAIWLRCVVDGPLKEDVVPGDRPPILYLPGVARQDLRAGMECPDALKPLVELMFRGTMWLQHNGSDWAARTFLGSKKALNLDVAGDQATNEALLRSLPEVVAQPIDNLRGHTLYADDFDKLLSGDYIRDLLRWMSNPDETKATLGENRWSAFVNQCTSELGFNPDAEPDIVAGERLGTGEGGWAMVWQRFTEAPQGYPGVVDLLRRSRPSSGLFANGERWPDLNDEQEDAARKTLSNIKAMPHNQACEAVRVLEDEHGKRRESVWARLGLSSIAEVLEPLARLADGAISALNGQTPDDMAKVYTDRGWKTDVAAWEAVAASTNQDEGLVSEVVKHLLEPWLEQTTLNFQKAVERTPIPAKGEQPTVKADDDMCLLFADGLRYDTGQRLVEKLEGRGCRVEGGHRWAALPTVTATAKPAVTPVVDEIIGTTLGETFEPEIEATGKKANAEELRKRMTARGYQVLDRETALWPQNKPARGWIQAGEIDSLGHKMKARLARHLNEEIDRLVEQILNLLDADWASVRVVTDHGWLILPGGLPKVDLPRHLTKSRWARCAAIAGESSPDVPRLPWFWNGSATFACPPGIACFHSNEEYTHGGVSLQECLIPDLVVHRVEGRQHRVEIRSVTWLGMRCLIEISPGGGKCAADLRLEHAAGKSVVVKAKTVDADGSVNLLMDGDEYEQAQLVLVIIDEGNTILAQKPVKLGDNQ